MCVFRNGGLHTFINEVRAQFPRLYLFSIYLVCTAGKEEIKN